MHVEMFLDASSSWCLIAAPAWESLRKRYAGRVTFGWSIALLDGTEALGYTPESMAWYYRRTAHMTGDMLNPAWIEGPHSGSLNANLAVAAARTLGVDDDRAWLAVAKAAMRDGLPIGRLETSVEIVARATGLDAASIAARAAQDEVLEYVRDSTARFRSLGLPQRPAFVLTSEIGDEARFSGVWVEGPLAATLDVMIADADGSRAYVLEAPPEPKRDS